MWGTMKIALALVAAASLLLAPPAIRAAQDLDLQVRFQRYHVDIEVHPDGTAVETTEWSLQVLKETAVAGAKRASISYSTSAQTAEVVAAYTQKADGRRIDVPKDNYQVEINRGRGKDSPVYSDRTSTSVVFPDVAVGDSVVFAYRIVDTEPLFPKHFSTEQVYYNQVAHDDVRVRITYPRSLWVQYEARGMKESVDESDRDRRVLQWSYANPRPVKSERRDFSVFDPAREAGFAFSTFRSYEEIATAYGERALPKAAVTDRISKLAADIVKDHAGPREEARALYEWVATHITYAGNCIGIGAVVPRDLPFVLDNRMGDCKDHATLLQSLLAARKIRSIQALVNAGSVYRLGKIPVVSSVNHVINYLPDLDLYLDSTSDSTPFGMLPGGDQGKPVLLVQGYREGARTPVAAVGSNRHSLRTEMKVAADGSVTAEVEVNEAGMGAVQARDWARKMTRNTEDDFVRDLLRARGMVGAGKFEKDDPTALADTYHYKVTMHAEKFLRYPGAGALSIEPPLQAGATIADFAAANQDVEADSDTLCYSLLATEDYVIEFPPALKVLSVPDDKSIARGVMTYEAKYALQGNRLVVHREVVDRTKGIVCTPAEAAEAKKFTEEVMDNLREQVLYK